MSAPWARLSPMCTAGHTVRQVEGGSALRDDSRPCFTLAQADAASHAEGDNGCKQRNYKLLHLRPPKF